MTTFDSVVTRLGPVKTHVLYVAHEIADRFGPLYFIWGAPGRGTGDHAKGLALDFMTYELGDGVENPGDTRIQLGRDIAEYVLANRVRLNVAYIIYLKTIVSAKSKWKWRPYDGDNPHTDHVHVSFKATGTYKPPAVQEDDDELADIDYNKIADAVWDKILDHPEYKGKAATAEGWVTSDAIRISKAVVAIAAAIEALANATAQPSVRTAVRNALKDIK